ncbi:MAG: alpha-2-macroglobulin family protein [Leptospiraceae bacterium]
MLKPFAPIRAYFRIHGRAGIIPAVAFVFLSGFLSLLLAGLWRAVDRPLEALPAAISNPLEEPGAPNPNILEVIQASPRGLLETAQLEQEIIVVFNHPMVPLGRVEEAKRESFRIEPAIKGKIRWYGTRVAAFIPEEPLKPGSSYKITVPEQKALNGKEMAKSYSFSFRTPPLKLHYSYPYSGNRIRYEEEFKLYFNYPVSIRDIQRMGKILANGRPVGFEATYRMDDSDDSDLESEESRSRVRLIPKEELPRNAKIQIILGKGLPPEGGNDGLEQEAVITYQTYGPLEVSLSEKKKYFQDAWGVGLRFNNPVNPATALQHIRLDPPLKRSTPDEDETTFMSVREWPVEAGQTVTIHVSAGLTDVMGNKLAKSHKFEVQLPVYRPDFSMRYGTSEVIESEMKQQVAASMAAIPEFTVGHRALDVSDIQQYLANSSSSSYLKKLSYKTREIKTNLKPVDAATFGVDFSPYLDSKKRGWVAVYVAADTLDWKDRKQRESSYRILQSTDLGMIVKESPRGIHVWVHKLSNNKPVSDATVDAYTISSKHGSCKTDAKGYCEVKRNQDRLTSGTLVVASTKEDRAFLTSRDHYRYTWSVSSYFDYTAGYPDLKGLIEFDRRLYRPGEQIHIKAFLALLSHGKLEALSKNKGKVFATVTNSRGKVIKEGMLSGTDEGGVDLSLDTEKDAPTGHYTVQLRLMEINGRPVKGIDGFPDRELSATFQVEEFRPATFSASIDGVQDSVDGSTLDLVARGVYLFGAPMSGASSTLSLYANSTDISDSRFRGFAFGDWVYDEYESTSQGLVARLEGTLDGKGEMRHAFRTNLAHKKPLILETENAGNIELKPHLTLTVENQVRDLGDRSVSTTRSATVFADEVFPGIKRLRYFVAAGQPAKFQLIALNKNKRVESADLTIEVFRRVYRTSETRGPGGSARNETTETLERVSKDSLETGASPVEYSFTPREAGSYFIVARTSSGAYARVPFYAGGSGYGYWGLSRDDRIELIPEQTDYKPGDTASILIQSPYKNATAIITVEREKVFEQRTIELTSSAQSIQVPIKGEYLPEIHVGVMLIRPRTEANPTRTEDPGKPQFKMGMIRLNVSSEQKRIPLTIKTSCDPCKPGMEVTTTIRTVPNAEVALSVADRAVLDLLNYNFSDPVQAMYSGWPLGVRVLENRGSLIEQLLLATKGDSPGGGGDEQDSGGFGLDGDQSTRRNFKYTAYWNPTLKANSKGEIQFTFKLPDNLTTFRFMAMAARDGGYAKTDYEIQVRRDIVIQKLIPRFIRPGDKLEVGSLVINSTNAKKNLKLQMKLEGLKCEKPLSKNMSLSAGETGEATETCWLPMPEKKAELPVSGTELKGSFDASENGRTLDAMEFQFPILIERYREAFATTGMATSDQKGEEFISIPDPAEYPAEVEIQLSSTVLQALEGAFYYFDRYPYLCLEQRSSAYLVSLVTPERYLPEKFMGKYSRAQLEDLVLDSIGEFQNANGGFRLWKEDTSGLSSPYTTAYVFLVLQEAKKRGRPVSARTLARAEAYLRNYSKNPEKDFRGYLLETLSLINYVLRDRPVAGLTDYLVKHRDDLSLRSSAYLLLSDLESGAIQLDASVSEQLLQRFQNQVRWNARRAELQERVSFSYSRAFYSEEGTVALWLRVLTAWKPQHPLVPRLVQSVIVRNPYKSSSHSEALMALALANYHEKIEKSADTGYSITMGKKSIFDGKLTEKDPEKNLKLSADQLKEFYTGSLQNFDFVSRGPGQLYYTTWMQYTIPPLRPEPADEGIEVHRTIQPLDQALGKGSTSPFVAGEDEMKRGRIYLVRITVTTTRPLSHFILRDPLPSHSEIVNTGFATESFSASGLRTQSSDSYWWASPALIDHRDDAFEVVQTYLPAGAHQFVYLIRPLFRGQALYPAASAYSMYEPEIFGRSADAIQVVE